MSGGCPNQHEAVYNFASYPNDPDINTKIKNSAFWGTITNCDQDKDPQCPPTYNPNRDSRFACQGALNIMSSAGYKGDPIDLKVCGCQAGDWIETPDGQQVRYWTNALKDWPCVKEFPVHPVYTDLFGGHDLLTPPSFMFENTYYDKCVDNWNKVLTGTSRFPCQQYAAHVDLTDSSKITKDIKIPDDVYKNCLTNQDIYLKTPTFNDCPTGISVEGSTPDFPGYDGTEHVDSTPIQYCICNCQKAQIDMDTCTGLCGNNTGGFATAADVKNGGWYYDATQKKCVITDSLTGEFQTEDICEQVYKTGLDPSPTSPVIKQVLLVVAVIVLTLMVYMFYKYKTSESIMYLIAVLILLGVMGVVVYYYVTFSYTPTPTPDPTPDPQPQPQPQPQPKPTPQPAPAPIPIKINTIRYGDTVRIRHVATNMLFGGCGSDVKINNADCGVRLTLKTFEDDAAHFKIGGGINGLPAKTFDLTGMLNYPGYTTKIAWCNTSSQGCNEDITFMPQADSNRTDWLFYDGVNPLSLAFYGDHLQIRCSAKPDKVIDVCGPGPDARCPQKLSLMDYVYNPEMSIGMVVFERVD